MKITHKMNLKDGPFGCIKNGTKTIELRLNDKKRQLLKKKDLIDKLEAEDKHILELYFTIKSADKTEEFDNYSNELFVWSSRLIKDYSI